VVPHELRRVFGEDRREHGIGPGRRDGGAHGFGQRVAPDLDEGRGTLLNPVLERHPLVPGRVIDDLATGDDAHGQVAAIAKEALEPLVVALPLGEVEPIAGIKSQQAAQLARIDRRLTGEIHRGDRRLRAFAARLGRLGTAAGPEVDLVPELDGLLEVVARRHPDLVSAAGLVHDHPGQLVLVEVLREDDLEEVAETLGDGEARGRIHVGRHQVEIGGLAEAHGVEPDERASEPEDVGRHRTHGEALAACRLARDAGRPPGEQQRAKVALTERRVGRQRRLHGIGWAREPQVHLVVAHAGLRLDVQGRRHARGRREADFAVEHAVSAPAESQSAVLEGLQLALQGWLAHRAKQAHVGQELGRCHAVLQAQRLRGGERDIERQRVEPRGEGALRGRSP